MINVCRIGIFIFCIVLGNISNAQADAIEISCEVWPPYLQKDPTRGVVKEITETALGEYGYKVSWKLYPWTRAMRVARTGEVAGLACAWYSDERNENFHYSDPYLINRLSFAKKKNRDITWHDLSDLKHYRFATIREAVVSPEFDVDAKFEKIEVVSSAAALKLILFDRADLYPDDEANIMNTLHINFPDQIGEIDFVDMPVTLNPLHFIVSRQRKDHEKLIEGFNSGLKTLMETGQYLEILKKYDLERLAVQ